MDLEDLEVSRAQMEEMVLVDLKELTDLEAHKDVKVPKETKEEEDQEVIVVMLGQEVLKDIVDLQVLKV